MPQFMNKAIQAAKRVLGGTYPNPPVGAVLVREEEIIACGATHPAGGAHAEIVCLDAAGPRATGADMFVTLEPCSHHGKTPPCVDRIISAGVRRIFIACRDPNPLVNGKGIARLQEAGIETVVGLSEERAFTDLYRPFFHFIATGRPWVTVKFAMTLDGKIACASGDSKWISGESSRQTVQTLRRSCQAIMVGAGTVRQDDPGLDYRGEDENDPRFQPKRIVLTRSGQIDSSARVFRDDGRAMLFVNGDSPLPDIPGCRVGRADPEMIRFMHQLGEAGVVSLLVEGGQGLFDKIFSADLCDELVVFVAPKIVGGERSPLHAVIATKMADARQYSGSWSLSGDDALFTGVRLG